MLKNKLTLNFKESKRGEPSVLTPTHTPFRIMGLSPRFSDPHPQGQTILPILRHCCLQPIYILNHQTQDSLCDNLWQQQQGMPT